MQNKNPEKTGNLYSKYWGYTQIGEKWGQESSKNPIFDIVQFTIGKGY